MTGMGMRTGEVDYTAVTVIGTHSPARSIAMARVLDDCVQRHGWGDRVSVAAAGLGPGAGLAAPDDVEIITSMGFDVRHASCPSLDDATAVVDEASCLVVGSEAEADLLLQWPIADGKMVLAFADFLEDAGTAFCDPGTQLKAFVETLERAVQELLRSLVAIPV